MIRAKCSFRTSGGGLRSGTAWVSDREARGLSRPDRDWASALDARPQPGRMGRCDMARILRAGPRSGFSGAMPAREARGEAATESDGRWVASVEELQSRAFDSATDQVAPIARGGGVNGLALCAGVGGLELGLRLAIGDEYRVVGFVEKRVQARRTLSRNLHAFGGAAAFRDDIRTEDFRRWRGCVDVLSAGWPCQGFSTASRGRPTHPDLWPDVRRAVAECEPRFVLLENVTTAPWPVVQLDLERLGFRVFRDVFCPSDLGAPHRRPRTFLLAYSNGEGESLGAVDAEVAGIPAASGCDPGAVAGALRVDDGAPGRMDQFRLAGEGVIPAVAACAWRVLSERLTREGAA